MARVEPSVLETFGLQVAFLPFAAPQHRTSGAKASENELPSGLVEKKISNLHLVGGFSPTHLKKCDRQIWIISRIIRGEKNKYVSCQHLVIR